MRFPKYRRQKITYWYPFDNGFEAVVVLYGDVGRTLFRDLLPFGLNWGTHWKRSILPSNYQITAQQAKAILKETFNLIPKENPNALY